MAGINGSGKSFKINKQVAEKLNKVDIRKLEVRKLQRYNDNIHWTALSAQRKKQSKILLTVWIFIRLGQPMLSRVSLCYPQTFTCWKLITYSFFKKISISIAGFFLHIFYINIFFMTSGSPKFDQNYSFSKWRWWCFYICQIFWCQKIEILMCFQMIPRFWSMVMLSWWNLMLNFRSLPFFPNFRWII